MKLYILIQEVHVFGRRISATVLGSPDDYERDISVTYPAQVEAEPTADNGWSTEPVPTFTMDDLKVGLEYMGYSGTHLENYLGRFVLHPHRDMTFSGGACHMPSIGEVKVSTRTIEVEV